MELVDRRTKKADLVIVRAHAAGPEGVLVARRSNQSRGKGGRPGVPVWAVVERGALLPGPLWEQLLARSTSDVPVEVMPLGDIGSAVTDRGLVSPRRRGIEADLPTRGRAARMAELNALSPAKFTQL